MRKAFIRDTLSLVLDATVHRLTLCTNAASRSKLLDIALSRYPSIRT